RDDRGVGVVGGGPDRERDEDDGERLARGAGEASERRVELSPLPGRYLERGRSDGGPGGVVEEVGRDVERGAALLEAAEVRDGHVRPEAGGVLQAVQRLPEDERLARRVEGGEPEPGRRFVGKAGEDAGREAAGPVPEAGLERSRHGLTRRQ